MTHIGVTRGEKGRSIERHHLSYRLNIAHRLGHIHRLPDRHSVRLWASLVVVTIGLIAAAWIWRRRRLLVHLHTNSKLSGRNWREMYQYT